MATNKLNGPSSDPSKASSIKTECNLTNSSLCLRVRELASRRAVNSRRQRRWALGPPSRRMAFCVASPNSEKKSRTILREGSFEKNEEVGGNFSIFLSFFTAVRGGFKRSVSLLFSKRVMLLAVLSSRRYFDQRICFSSARFSISCSRKEEHEMEKSCQCLYSFFLGAPLDLRNATILLATVLRGQRGCITSGKFERLAKPCAKRREFMEQSFGGIGNSCSRAPR